MTFIFKPILPSFLKFTLVAALAAWRLYSYYKSEPYRLGSPRKIRLLVVDDNCDFANSLRAFLERQGLMVDGVNEAMAFLVSDHYSAVIADLRLSGSDESEGLRILERFKKSIPKDARFW